MFSICSTTVALNFEEVESHPESVPNVISCINSSVNVKIPGTTLYDPKSKPNPRSRNTLF